MHVTTTPDSSTATFSAFGHTSPAIIGRSGPVPEADKREGDGATPLGSWPLLFGYYRPDRVPVPPQTGFKWVPLAPDMGWCDDPTHPQYNQQVTLPFSASHEQLWREDTAYDYILVPAHNHPAATPGKGSAIFLHIWHPGKTHTEGCVALKVEDLQALLPHLTPATQLTIS